MSDPDDHHAARDLLVAEILDDLQRRRDAGEVPVEYEAELDRAYAAVAPPAAVDGDGTVMIELASAKSGIHPHAPVVARSRPGGYAKRLVRKATFWYVAWLADAIADFAGAIIQATRLVERRVRRLEAEVLDRTARIEEAVAGLPELALPGGATEATVFRLAGVRGPIAAEDARALVDVLRRERPPGSVRTGVSGSAPDSLEAVVLAGVVDRSTSDVAVRLVHGSARALRAGGLLLIISSDPSAPCSDEGLIARELSGGRPLSVPTWRYLLTHSGFDQIAVEDLVGGALVSAILDP